MRQLMFACLVVSWLVPVNAAAQTPPAAALRAVDADERPRLKLDLSRIDFSDSARTEELPVRVDEQGGNRSSGRSATRKFFGVIVGGTAGFFAGGYTGAWIEGDRCHCDDPGLKGAIIGSLSGAAVGAILGGLFLF